MFYCSIIKVPGLYPTFFTLTFLYQCYRLAVCVSDIYLITFALACQELFYFIFWNLSKNKILEIFLISCFRTNKKLYAFTLCFLSLFATAICILQHFTVVVNTFFHFLSLTFQPYKKLLYIVDSTTTERVGFEPTRPCGQTVFKTASLWPLRYLSIIDKIRVSTRLSTYVHNSNHIHKYNI